MIDSRKLAYAYLALIGMRGEDGEEPRTDRPERAVAAISKKFGMPASVVVRAVNDWDDSIAESTIGQILARTINRMDPIYRNRSSWEMTKEACLQVSRMLTNGEFRTAEARDHDIIYQEAQKSRVKVIDHFIGLIWDSFGDFPEQFRSLCDHIRENDLANEVETNVLRALANHPRFDNMDLGYLDPPRF